MGTSVPSVRKGRGRRPELKAVDPRGLALPILQRIGGTGETGLLLGQQVGRGKHPASNPSSSKLVVRTLASSNRPSDPRYLVGQKSEALGEFSLGPGQKWVCGPSDVGLPGINRPPSVPSPGLLPKGPRMSVFLLHCFV